MKTRTLLLLDGVVWLTAGINVCKIGIETWRQLQSTSAWMIVACLVTMVAFGMMFVKMVFKNERRIEQMAPERRRVWHMMAPKSYLIMAFMITLGVVLRHSPAIPASFIAWFYTGLGTGLAMAGVVYLRETIHCTKTK